MATLVFTAVGTAVGGPIGGLVGSPIGQQVDNALFAPKARQGPRLGDLAVQTSSYGSAIPKMFGTLRAAGTVIWATGLKESKSTTGGGKGKPKTTTYSYSASFAVALSGRPIRTVRRIWADGKLLRGAAGDFKTRTGFRLYTGSEGQGADPLIASREGIEATPAFRGLAYAVFEDFQLADYGNRIPSLTFEIVADDGQVPVGTIAATLSAGAAGGGETPSLGGYAASGDSVHGALEPLFALMPLSLREDEQALIVSGYGSLPVALSVDANNANGKRTEFSRRAPGLTPDEVAIAYHDPARDYQTGFQRATRGGAVRIESRGLPASLPAHDVKGLATYRLKALWAGRETARVHLGSVHARLRPGALVTLQEVNGLWKIERLTFERMVVTLDLVRVPGGLPQPIAAAPGRASEQPDAPHGETVLIAADLPLGEEEARAKPLLFVASAGTAAGWRQAELIVSYDGGRSYEAGGMTAGSSVIGHLTSGLANRGSALIDLTNSVDVELLHDEMWLESCDDLALAGGANLALVGSELLQFGRADAIGERRFRLSRLLRGRRGTEWAAGHRPGAAFTLIDRASLVAIEPPMGVVGATAKIVGQGIGDSPEGVSVLCDVTGEAVRPPAPVHLRAAIDAAGNLHLSWARRSRTGWFWLDGGDAPLAEEQERYEVRLASEVFDRRIETDAPAYLYSAAARQAEGSPAAIMVEVVQIGTFARSRHASLTITF